jgi:DNA-binding NarL/FixJ family response regulator
MRAGRPLRVVVAEDEALYRELLCAGLGQQPGLEIVGSFPSGESLIRTLGALQPDVALLDLDLGPGIDGLRTGLRLRADLPDIGVVLLTHHAAPRLLATLPPEALGGWAYLLKRSVADVAALHRAIIDAADGRLVIDPRLVRRRAYHMTGRLGRLTARQRDIVELLAMGWDNGQIASHLSLSTKTVENQLSRIYEALELRGVHPRVRTVLIYLEETYTESAASA